MTLSSTNEQATRFTGELVIPGLEHMVGEITQNLQSVLEELVQDGIRKALVKVDLSPSPEGLWTPQQTADYLGVKRQTLRAWDSASKGPAPTKIEGRTMYRPEIVRQYAKDRTSPR